MTITDLITNFGDLFQLKIQWNIERTKRILENNPHWVQYNPKKPYINRQGLSVTSLDGGYSGVPDLDSIKEYNHKNKTNYSEANFNILTPITEEIPETKYCINFFPRKDIGRCHFLRLGVGGFFPPHRDNGLKILPNTFRVIGILDDFDPMGQNVWLQEGKPLSLKAGNTYFINTTKIHSLFSFSGVCNMFVMNIVVSPESLNCLVKLSTIS